MIVYKNNKNLILLFLITRIELNEKSLTDAYKALKMFERMNRKKNE